jgi:mannosyltransferase OCH1-like enzyme
MQNPNRHLETLPAATMNIIQYWDTENIPDDVLSCINSFPAQNPDAKHFVFNATTADAFIAEHFSSRELNAFRACAVPAMQADYFRLCAILVLGGIYADADAVCLRGLRPLFDAIDRVEFYVHGPKGNVPNNFFLVREKNNPFIRTFLDLATYNIERRASGIVWAVTGPGILTVLYWLAQGDRAEDFAARLAIRNDDTRQSFAEILAEVGRMSRLRITESLAGVRFQPWTVRAHYIRDMRLAHHQTPVHWSNWQGHIYRTTR